MAAAKYLGSENAVGVPSPQDKLPCAVHRKRKLKGAVMRGGFRFGLRIYSPALSSAKAQRKQRSQALSMFISQEERTSAAAEGYSKDATIIWSFPVYIRI
jgi:hypothetical protein